MGQTRKGKDVASSENLSSTAGWHSTTFSALGSFIVESHCSLPLPSPAEPLASNAELSEIFTGKS